MPITSPTIVILREPWIGSQPPVDTLAMGLDAVNRVLAALYRPTLDLKPRPDEKERG